jgi:hypothetical protein
MQVELSDKNTRVQPPEVWFRALLWMELVLQQWEQYTIVCGVLQVAFTSVQRNEQELYDTNNRSTITHTMSTELLD